MFSIDEGLHPNFVSLPVDILLCNFIGLITVGYPRSMRNLQLLCSDATETSIQDPPHLFVVDVLSQTIFIATSKELFSFSVADKKVRSLSGEKRASDAFHNGVNNSGRGRTKREDKNVSSGIQ